MTGYHPVTEATARRLRENLRVIAKSLGPVAAAYGKLQGNAYAAAKLWLAIDTYHNRASAIGLSGQEARTYLEKRINEARASKTLTSLDAIERASRDLPLLVFERTERKRK